MANMSYCRFENTYRALLDCTPHLHDENLSKSEARYRDALIELCNNVLEDKSDDDDE